MSSAVFLKDLASVAWLLRYPCTERLAKKTGILFVSIFDVILKQR